MVVFAASIALAVSLVAVSFAVVASVAVRNLVGCVTTLVLLMSVDAAQAQDADAVRQLRDWAADVIRGDSGDSGDSADSSFETLGDEASASFVRRLSGKIRQLAGEVAALIDRQIGWLRPSSVKEAALLWFAIAAALPWMLISLLRPILRADLPLVRLIVVGLLLGLALWTAWKIWGMAAGQDCFIASMLILAPVLALYFHGVASSVASGQAMLTSSNSVRVPLQDIDGRGAGGR